jgi:hypothetical protein
MGGCEMMANLLESQGFTIFIIVSSVISLIFGLFGTIIGLIAMIKVMAIEKSTHTVTYQPIDEEIEKANADYLNNWATQESVIAKDREEFQEELEEQMPDFFPDDEDRKIRSF